jgi:nicotinamide-nucleotide amidase
MESEFEGEVQRILTALRKSKESLAVAESLTGGLLGGAITAVAGASDVFLGGVIAYQPQSKSQALGITPDLITTYGVVSREVALAMAHGVQEKFGSDWAISTTGVAGPGPSGGVPAGRVWIAIVGPRLESAPLAQELDLSGGRTEIRQATIARALGVFTRILYP